MYDILELNKKLLTELRDIAKELKIKRVESFKKQTLIYQILDQQAILAAETKTTKPPQRGANQAEESEKRQSATDRSNRRRRKSKESTGPVFSTKDIVAESQPPVKPVEKAEPAPVEKPVVEAPKTAPPVQNAPRPRRFEEGNRDRRPQRPEPRQENKNKIPEKYSRSS